MVRMAQATSKNAWQTSGGADGNSPISWITLIVIEDEAADHIHVSYFGADAIIGVGQRSALGSSKDA